MSNDPEKPEIQKITVSLPADLVEQLSNRVPARQRSLFIAEAIEEYLTRIEQVEAIDEAAGSWREEDHPELKTPADIDRWINELRQQW